MAADIWEICDPARFLLAEAIAEAGVCDVAAPPFELRLVKFLQELCQQSPVPSLTVFRGLEVLSGLLRRSPVELTRMITLLRPFLLSGNLQIASKCVLILGRQDRKMEWLNGIIHATERDRANIIESLWPRKEPEVIRFLERALLDPSQRVAANAVYGLYLRDHHSWAKALDALVADPSPAFRRSGVWVIKAAAPPDAHSRLRPLIRDTDPNVRRAAFDALKHLRQRAQPG